MDKNLASNFSQFDGIDIVESSQIELPQTKCTLNLRNRNIPKMVSIDMVESSQNELPQTTCTLNLRNRNIPKMIDEDVNKAKSEIMKGSEMFSCMQTRKKTDLSLTHSSSSLNRSLNVSQFSIGDIMNTSLIASEDHTGDQKAEGYNLRQRKCVTYNLNLLSSKFYDPWPQQPLPDIAHCTLNTDTSMMTTNKNKREKKKGYDKKNKKTKLDIKAVKDESFAKFENGLDSSDMQTEMSFIFDGPYVTNTEDANDFIGNIIKERKCNSEENWNTLASTEETIYISDSDDTEIQFIKKPSESDLDDTEKQFIKKTGTIPKATVTKKGDSEKPVSYETLTNRAQVKKLTEIQVEFQNKFDLTINNLIADLRTEIEPENYKENCDLFIKSATKNDGKISNDEIYTGLFGFTMSISEKQQIETELNEIYLQLKNKK